MLPDVPVEPFELAPEPDDAGAAVDAELGDDIGFAVAAGGTAGFAVAVGGIADDDAGPGDDMGIADDDGMDDDDGIGDDWADATPVAASASAAAANISRLDCCMDEGSCGVRLSIRSRVTTMEPNDASFV